MTINLSDYFEDKEDFMKGKRIFVFVLLALCICFLPARNTVAAVSYRNQFVKAQNGNISYFNSKGVKAKGIITVKGRKYYMDSRGILRTGWRKVGQKYYFFGQINGGAGYMRTSARINGIQVRKDGSASYNRTQLQKLNLMVRANQIVDGITNNRMTKPQKLRACFRYIVNYNYGDGGDFAGGSNWDIYYGSRVLSRRRGDCFGFGCAFAYLADAVGYTSYAVSSGGHGWAEVNGRVYDANWAKATGRIDWYCGMDYNLSGRGGRPNYKPNRVYVKRI